MDLDNLLDRIPALAAAMIVAFMEEHREELGSL